MGKIKDKSSLGRRTGLGTTAEGDMLALGILRSEKPINFQRKYINS